MGRTLLTSSFGNQAAARLTKWPQKSQWRGQGRSEGGETTTHLNRPTQSGRR